MNPRTNAADENQVRQGKQKDQRTKEREIDDLKGLLSTPGGRRFLWRYIEFCGIFESSFSSSGSEMFFLEGQRNVGLKLIKEIMEADANAYIVMMKESKGDL